MILKLSLCTRIKEGVKITIVYCSHGDANDVRDGNYSPVNDFFHIARYPTK